jgi:hypothetical protein
MLACVCVEYRRGFHWTVKRTTCDYYASKACVTMLGGGSQQWTFSFLWVPELSPCFCRSNSRLNDPSPLKYLKGLFLTYSATGQSIWGPRPDYHCRTFAVFVLCGVLSEERTDMSCTSTICNILLPRVKVSQPGGPGPCIYIPQEQNGPVIPPGTRLCVASYGGGILTRLHSGVCDSV